LFCKNGKQTKEAVRFANLLEKLYLNFVNLFISYSQYPEETVETLSALQSYTWLS